MPVGSASGINPTRKGSGTPSSFVSQVVTSLHPDYATLNINAPNGANFAFLEMVARGGSISLPSLAAGGGGGGGDAVANVASGAVIAIAATTISVNGTTVVSVTQGGTGAGGGTQQGSGGTGKYPGEAASSVNIGGKGGGRLAGASVGRSLSNSAVVGGVGSGAAGSTGGSVSVNGAPGLAVVTFFTSEAAAIAFAQACYNGAWVP